MAKGWGVKWSTTNANKKQMTKTALRGQAFGIV